MLHYKLTRNFRGRCTIITSTWHTVLVGVQYWATLINALSFDEEYGLGKA